MRSGCRAYARSHTGSLPTGSVRIGLRLVDEWTVVEIGNGTREGGDVRRDASHARIVDVLGLVAHHVIVDVPRRGAEEHDRDAEAGIHVVIAAAVRVRGIAVLIESIVEPERFRAARVHPLGEAAELGGETTRADDDERGGAGGR